MSPDMDAVTVLVVDDEPLVRRGLVSILGAQPGSPSWARQPTARRRWRRRGR
ncbi:hypothetical protein FHU33_1909 [Blastococcus colisei]|uniref:Response regulatory domain-containing protein n=1 Tax=Blastococcus colisei TaxID=1564162 RepID=A0A543PEM4_9ACTN|nr:hypothetical protein FHU33_1909 [Blastococcus colisei]